METIVRFFSLLWPIALGIVAILEAYFIPQRRLQKNVFVEFFASLLRLFVWDDSEVSRYKGIIARSTLIAVGIGFFLFPTIRDYSAFFPSRFQITVLFDLEGLDSAITEFGESNIQMLNLESDWKDSRQTVINNLNRDLHQAGYNFQFLSQRGITVGRGEGIFKVTKVGWNSQRYKITEAKGILTFETPAALGSDVRRLETDYDLVDTDTAYITQPGFSVYYPHSILARPEFRQYAHISPTNRTFYMIVTAATLIPVPLFKIEKTIYLAAGQHGGNIPIGYAILIPASN